MHITNTKTAISTILARSQTTIPVAVRDRFGLREGDLLEWQFDASVGALIVRPMRADFLPPQGAKTILRAWQAHQSGETKEISIADLENEAIQNRAEREVTD